jgi:2-keto-4-pentenoate hydratase/2-oxohepta-3-ene-1,7-dioic acid hydratase in catechol pathway
MKLCRFGANRLGVLDDKGVRDVTPALQVLPALHWPVAQGDHLIRHLPTLLDRIATLLPDAPYAEASALGFLSPIANPSKIIAAPLNYTEHVNEVSRDPAIHAGTRVFDFDGFPTPIDKLGLFLKANTSLAGAGEGIELIYPERRTDHEVELVAVIGQEARNVSEQDALDIVCGYCVGLDMTVRGPEDRSFRKSPDSYTILGPIFATSDEIPDPDDLDLSITVNGLVRQTSNTRCLTVGLRRLIAIASSCYTLQPCDIIMTGTPNGVGPVAAGDEIVASIARLGQLRTQVRAGAPIHAVHGRQLGQAAQ